MRWFGPMSGCFVVRSSRKLLSRRVLCCLVLATLVPASLLGEGLHYLAAVDHRPHSPAGHGCCSSHGHLSFGRSVAEAGGGHPRYQSSSDHGHHDDCLICRFLSQHKHDDAATPRWTCGDRVATLWPAAAKHIAAAGHSPYSCRAPSPDAAYSLTARFLRSPADNPRRSTRAAVISFWTHAHRPESQSYRWRIGKRALCAVELS